MIAGTLPALGIHSSLRDLEAVATDIHRRMQRRYLFGLLLWCVGLQVSAAAMTLDTPTVLTTSRSLLAWFGIALIAGTCFGWPLSWTGPVGVFGLLAYWGVAGDGYAWWEFSARPAGDVPSALFSVCLFGAGISCYGVTRWRLRIFGGPSSRSHIRRSAGCDHELARLGTADQRALGVLRRWRDQMSRHEEASALDPD
jgi:hypothetical protein